MGMLVVHEFVTLDGVMQAPGGIDEDREGGFEHGGWQAPHGDTEAGQLIAEHHSRVKAILLGRKTTLEKPRHLDPLAGPNRC